MQELRERDGQLYEHRTEILSPLFLNPVVGYQREYAESHEIIGTDFSRILIIYTGGTIGMKAVPGQGYVPVHNWLMETLKSTHRFNDQEYAASTGPLADRVWRISEQGAISETTEPSLITPVSLYGKRIRYTILEYKVLLDSANMNLNDWIRIATDIEINYKHFDAFVVIHGTDTMAYTASALSFMLQDLGKTVILTGSQVPLAEWRTDAEENLLGALLMASHFVIPEVCVYFGNRLFRGNRCTKVDAMDFSAFDSPNMKPLAVMGVNVDVNWPEVRRPISIAKFSVEKILNPNVAALRLFPGITNSTVKAFLAPPIQGVVLETYGAGNAPDSRVDLLALFQEAIERGVVIVNCTQCKRGIVSSSYATGMALSGLGIIAGNDMTTECALTKLAYLLGGKSGRSVETIKKLVQLNLRGEMTTSTKAKKSELLSPLDRNSDLVDFVKAVVNAMRVNTIHEKMTVERALVPHLVCATAGLGNLDDFEDLKRLIEPGIINSVDYDGRTALQITASAGHFEIVKELLKSGASVHLRDKEGRTALACACRHGHVKVARLLADTGSYFDEDDDQVGFEILKAVIEGDLAKVELYNDCGFNLSKPLLLEHDALYLVFFCKTG